MRFLCLMKFKRILFIVSVFFLEACHVSRVIQPLDKGEHQIGLGAGGPTIELGGNVLPVPLSSIHYAYGWQDRTTLFGGLHLTSLGYGVAQVDIGGTYGFLEPSSWKPGLSTSVSGNFLLDFWTYTPSLYPQLDANLYWNYGQKQHVAYLGATNWLELRSMRSHGVVQDRRFLSGIQLGTSINHQLWSFGLEGKWLAPTRDSRNVTVAYKGFNGMGATGIYLTINKRWK
jgi:hypothetical protein